MAKELVLDVVARKNSKDLVLLAQEFELLAHEIDGANKSAQENVTFSRFLDDQIASTKKQVQELAQEFNKTGNADLFARLRGAQTNLTNLTRLRKQIVDVGDAQKETTAELEGSEKVLRELSDQYQSLGADTRRAKQEFDDLTDRIKVQTETFRTLQRQSGSDPGVALYARQAGKALDDLKDQAEVLKDALDAAPEDASKRFRSFDEFVQTHIAIQRKLVEDLQKDLAKTGNVSVFGDLKKAEKDLADLEGLAKTVGKAGEDIGKSFGQKLLGGVGQAFGFGRQVEPGIGGLLSSVLLTPQGIAGAAVIASAAGVTIGGALLAGLGAAGVGAGIALELNDPKVHAALEDFKAEVGRGLHGAASVFAQPLQDAIHIFRGEFEKDLPGIRDTFSALAPEVTVLARGAAGFAGGLLTGLEHAAVAAKPLLDDLGSWLPQFGKEVGGVFDTIANHKQEALDGLHNIEDLLSGITTVAKGTVIVLSDIDDALKYIPGSFSNTKEALYKITSLISGVSEADLKQQIVTQAGTTVSRAFTKASEDAAQALTKEGGAAGVAGDSLAKLNVELSTLINNQLSVAQANDAFQKGLNDLTGALNQSNHSLVGNSDAAIQNRGAIEALIGQAEKAREAQINLAGGANASKAAVDQANTSYEEAIKQIETVGVKAGLSKKDLDALAGEYDINVVIAIEQINASGLAQNIAPHDVHRKGNARAAGGPVIAGQGYVVGENGPEWFQPNVSGRIIPNLAAVPRFAPPVGGSGGGTTVTLNVTGDTGSPVGAMLKELVRVGALQLTVDSTGKVV